MTAVSRSVWAPGNATSVCVRCHRVTPAWPGQCHACVCAVGFLRAVYLTFFSGRLNFLRRNPGIPLRSSLTPGTAMSSDPNPCLTLTSGLAGASCTHGEPSQNPEVQLEGGEMPLAGSWQSHGPKCSHCPAPGTAHAPPVMGGLSICVFPPELRAGHIPQV